MHRGHPGSCTLVRRVDAVAFSPPLGKGGRTEKYLRLYVLRLQFLRLEVVKIEVLRLEVVKIEVLRLEVVIIEVLRLEVVRHEVINISLSYPLYLEGVRRQRNQSV